MKNWIFVTLLALCCVSIMFSIYDIYTYKKPPEVCIMNIVMVKHDDMYKQKGLWPTHCVAISKD